LSESVSVFSEKPIVQNNDFENYKFAKELIEIADRKKMVFTVNTQWPSVLQYLESYVNFNKIESFSMLMQPRDFGKDILLDQVPHTNSVLLQLIPKGVAQNIRFKSSLRESLEVFFDFISENGKCRVNYIFKYKETGQRELKMEFNGKLFSREVDKNYKQTLVSDDVIVPIPDPLSVSISKFVGALKGEDEVLINSNQMIKNIQLQDRIVKEFLEK
jgi:predicted dehydrogenase